MCRCIPRDQKFGVWIKVSHAIFYAEGFQTPAPSKGILCALGPPLPSGLRLPQTFSVLASQPIEGWGGKSHGQKPCGLKSPLVDMKKIPRVVGTRKIVNGLPGVRPNCISSRRWTPAHVDSEEPADHDLTCFLDYISSVSES